MLNQTDTLANVLAEKFITTAPQAAGRVLGSMATHEVVLLVSPLKAQTLVTCFNNMEPCKAAAVLRRLPARQAGYVFSRLDVMQAARMMKEFSQPYREKLSASLKPEFVALLKGALAFAPNSVGARMSTDFVSVKTDAKAADVIERLKNMPRKKLPPVCFVTAKDGQLKGAVRVAELLFYPEDSAVGSLMSADYAVLTPGEGETSAMQKFKACQWPLLPVVDGQNKLLGVLSPKLAADVQSPKKHWLKRLFKRNK